jgi:Polyketide cyclase / dehydrase and lipid transport
MVTLDRIRLTGLLRKSPGNGALLVPPAVSGRFSSVPLPSAPVWTTEHAVETSATPEAVWRLWADVPSWGEWNGDVERIELHGPFAVGSTILMTPKGEDPVRLELTEVDDPTSFVDEADGGEFVVRTHHLAEPLEDGRTRITYRMEIAGPAADTVGPEIGPRISGDFPQTLAALAARAEAG